jgi:hypothetical protein
MPIFIATSASTEMPVSKSWAVAERTCVKIGEIESGGASRQNDSAAAQ